MEDLFNYGHVVIEEVNIPQGIKLRRMGARRTNKIFDMLKKNSIPLPNGIIKKKDLDELLNMFNVDQSIHNTQHYPLPS